MVSVKDFERRARDLQSQKNKKNRSTASSDSGARDFNPSRQTLSEAIGRSTASDLRSGRVRRSSSSRSGDSSPAGGAGQASAISRFSGIEQATINKLSSSEQREVGQAASNTITGTLRAARDLGVRIDPSKASNIPALRSEVQRISDSGLFKTSGTAGSYRETSATDITTGATEATGMSGAGVSTGAVPAVPGSGGRGFRLRIPGAPEGVSAGSLAVTVAAAVGGYYVVTELL